MKPEEVQGRNLYCTYVNNSARIGMNKHFTTMHVNDLTLILHEKAVLGYLNMKLDCLNVLEAESSIY